MIVVLSLDSTGVDSDLDVARSSRFVRVIVGKLLDLHRVGGSGAIDGYDQSNLSDALVESLRTVLCMLGSISSSHRVAQTKFDELCQQVASA